MFPRRTPGSQVARARVPAPLSPVALLCGRRSVSMVLTRGSQTVEKLSTGDEESSEQENFVRGNPSWSLPYVWHLHCGMWPPVSIPRGPGKK